MVGVPGRSKACQNCRERRKGCDFKRPTCTRCLKAGLQCKGYARERIFVNTTSSATQSTEGSIDLRVKAYDKRASRSESATPPGSAVQFKVALEHSLSRAAYEDQTISTYLESDLPFGISSQRAAPRSSINWIDAVYQLYVKDDALRSVLLANHLSTVGCNEDIPWMCAEGLRLYTTALRQMAIGLRDPAKAKSDSMLVTSRLLGLYEMVFGWDLLRPLSQSHNWQLHKAGEMAILLRRSPWMHVTGFGHELFADSRLNWILNDVKARKRSILAEPEWKIIPWLKRPKTPHDALCDIGIEIPGLLEDLDKMRACKDNNSKENQRKVLMDRCWVLDSELAIWKGNMGHEGWTEDTIKTLAEQGSQSDLSVLNLVMLYLVICVLLYSTMEFVSSPEERDRFCPRIEPRQYCRQISRLVPSLMDPATGTFGLFAAALPVGIALQYTVVMDPPEQASDEALAIWDIKSLPRGCIVIAFLQSLLQDIGPAWPTAEEFPHDIIRRARKWMLGNC